MINVSAECRELMQTSPEFYATATITFPDGSEMELGENDFTIGKNKLTDGASVNGIPLGVAICRKISIEIFNFNDRFANISFLDARIRFVLKMPLSSTKEILDMGTFTVLSPETYGDVIKVTACDDMYKLDKPFSSNLIFPVDAGILLRDICSSCDVPFVTTIFRNSDFSVAQPSDGLTFRQVLGYIAMLAVGNARVNRSGYIEILEYDFTDLTSEANTARHDLTKWIALKTELNDITITGVRTRVQTDNGENEIQIGESGYIVRANNPLCAGQEELFLSMLNAVLVGNSFRKFDGDYISNPTIEFMDPIKITDRKGNISYSFVTDVVITALGGTDIQNSAETPIRLQQTYPGPDTAAIIEAKRLVEKEKTDREVAMESLARAIENGTGFFATNVLQEDGSTIYYLHDKPTLEASLNVVKITSEAFGFSTDGGESYPFGWTITGDMVMKILDAEGINADWITFGVLQAKDPEVFYLDIDEGIVNINGKSIKIKGKSVTTEEALENSIGYSQTIAGSMVTITSEKYPPYLAGMTIYGKGEQDGTPTPENPIPIVGAGESGEINITAAGKNLYDASTYPLTDGFFVNFSHGGHASSAAHKATLDFIPCSHLAGKTIVLNRNPGGNHPGIAFYMGTTKESFISGFKYTGIVPDDAMFMRFCVPIDATDIQLEAGSTATSYEPYQATTATLSTGLPLYAIPVSSGGNVTIDGQEYVADYVRKFADGTGEVVKHIQKYIVTGLENWRASANTIGRYDSSISTEPKALYYDCLTSYYPYIGVNRSNTAWVNNESKAYLEIRIRDSSFVDVTALKTWLSEKYSSSNPMYFLYIAEPVTIPLTAEEVAELEALETYKPVTNIWNDAGAHMEVEYYSEQMAENARQEKGAEKAQETADDAKAGVGLLGARVTTVETNLAEFSVEQNAIKATVQSTQETFKGSMVSMDNRLETLTQQVSAKLDSQAVNIQIQEALDNGVDKVTTSTGFTFNGGGLTVNKSGTEMKTQITENGMKVFQNNTAVLVADNQGVEAKNLNASTFLIIGGRSRFENYGSNRTGCFWIGG